MATFVLVHGAWRGGWIWKRVRPLLNRGGHEVFTPTLTGVADRMPERIRALVYLDAFVLENGQSLHDTLPPEQREAQRQAAGAHGDAWQVPPIPAEFFNVGPEDRAWVNAQGTPQPLATFQQRLRLTGGIDRVRRSFVLATDFPDTPFRQFYDRAKAKGWKTDTVACGHDAMLAEPAEIARILLEAAG